MEKITNEFVGTVYASCGAQKGLRLDSVQNWINTVIKTDINKTIVTRYRQQRADGKDDEAQLTKKQLQAFICAAQCMNGRKEGEEEGVSCVVMADYDNHDAEWSAWGRELMKNYRWVVGAHLTVSYGLRLFIYIPSTPRRQFKQVLNAVLNRIDGILGYPHDPQATNRLRLSFASYDPDAWCREPDDCEMFPLEQCMQQPVLTAASLPDDAPKNTPGTPEAPDNAHQPSAARPAAPKAANSLERRYTDVQLDDLLTHFLHTHSLTEGSRNRSYLSLGRYARYKGLTYADYERLTEMAHSMYGDPEYTLNRIRECMEWGYNHDEEQQNCKTNYSKTVSAPFRGPEDDPWRKSTKSTKSTISLVAPENEGQDIDNQYTYDEMVMDTCPDFPDEVYEKLPSFFEPLLENTPSKRDKTLLFMGLLGTISAAMPNVRVLVRDKEYSTNLFFLGIAPAGTGKSIVLKPKKLLGTLQRRLNRQFNDKLKQYDKALSDWNLEQHLAIKEKREANESLRPGDKPEESTILSQSTTSRSMLLRTLKNNPHGILVVASELDALNESNSSDFGKFGAELRSINQNEPLGTNFKLDGRQFVIEYPKMSLVATGTPTQLDPFIEDLDKGMLSRCNIILGKSSTEWMPLTGYDREQYERSKKNYEEATRTVTQMYDYLEKFPTFVEIPDPVWEIADRQLAYFTRRLVEENHTELQSILNRAPITIGRICAMLAAIHKVDMGCTQETVYVTEEDMRIVVDIARVLIRHTCQASVLIRKRRTGTFNNLTPVFSEDTSYGYLPDEFTTSVFLDTVAKHSKWSRSKGMEMLKVWTEKGYIQKVTRGNYKKLRKNPFEC